RGRLPTPAKREFEAALRRLRGGGDRIAAGDRAAGGDPGDAAALLLRARAEGTGGGLTDEEGGGGGLPRVAAGHETSAHAPSWPVHHLGERPDLEAGVHAEVEELLGGRGVPFEDTPTLPFLPPLVMETLRPSPPAWILTRRTTTTARLGDVELPAG